MLPGIDGIELMERVPEMAHLPVIFISGYGRDETIARALEIGAADYIVKPFSPTELAARIEAVLRRRAASDRIRAREPYVLGDLTVNYAERHVTVAGRPVRLTATEYKLLVELSTNAGRVLTHDQLLGRVWGRDYSGDSPLLRSFVKKLRRKLKDDSNSPRYIFTEPRVGYRMATT
jgi:two-component system KDP operon response regulator KdpE